jgi:CIC family chloride channel protein
VNQFWPGEVAAAGAYALVGMAAVVAAATHAPITAILIVFELTNDYKIILPLMISCIIATILAMRLQDSSIYTLKLMRRGVDLRKGRSVDLLQSLPVSTVMRREFATVREDASVMSIISRFVEQSVHTVFVLDKHDRLAGVVTLDEIRYLMSDAEALESLAIAKDVMVEHNFPVFKPDDSLGDVMKRLAGHVHEAPIVEDGKVVGCIWPDDVIKQYNTEVFKRDMASGMTSMIDSIPSASVPGATDLRLAQVPVPPHFVGRSLAELDIRKRFGISVLMVKRKEEGREELVDAAPTPEIIFRDGDVVLLMGPEKQVRRFEFD